VAQDCKKWEADEGRNSLSRLFDTKYELTWS